MKSFTLTELIITMALLVILALVIALVLRAVLLSWSGQEARAGIDIALNRGIEEISRDLRAARQAQSVNSDELRFTQDSSNFYIYYLYNASDSYPPAFSQSSYELKKAVLSGGITGTFTYGSGQFISTDVLPPPTTDLSISGNLITIDINIARSGEIIRTATKIRPRNL